MAGPSLSHILDPPRPVTDPQLVPAPSFSPYEHAPAAVSTAATAPPPNSLPQIHTALPPAPPTTSGPPSTHTESPASSSRQGHNGSNLYACRDCGRSYSRPEHLVRHVQTHTLGRRFACDICKKSFARKDLLRRHVANHENDSPKKRRRMASSPGPGRVSQACRPCAAARVKCDDAKPCRRCVNRNLTCVSSEAGSAAAMHLVHLSVNAHNASANATSTVSSSAESVDSSSPLSHDQHRAMNLGPALHGYDTTNKNTPISQTTPSKPDDSQLPTPDTAVEQVNPDNFPQPFDPQEANTMDVNHVPFFDFLREVLYQQPVDPTKLVDSQGLPVLDFCDDMNMDLTDMDFGLLDHWNLDGMTEGGLPAPDMAGQPPQNSVDISQMRENLVKVWTNSPWRWDPANHDSGYKEQGNLPVSVNDTAGVQFQESRKRLERVIREKLDQSGRDRVLAIVLSTCRQNATASRVAASFPTVDVMDTMVHIFLASHACQVSSWIHFPTFKLNEQWPEWTGVAAAAGAVLTPVPTLRKFGFAVQEAVRITIPGRFEENNTAIQNLGLVQSLVLGQDLGLWSGNRRKMEIAECHLVIPVTMMRYRGKFRKSSYPNITVDASDEGEVLEGKWREWVALEQWKRLVFHCYIREAQISMTTLTNPCMSYSELTLPLPEPRELWFAKTASEWKARYLQRNIEQCRKAPSVGDLFHDVQQFLTSNLRLDMQLSISIFLHGFWSLILEYRQLSAVHQFRSYTKGTPNLLLSSRHQELVRDLQTFQFVTSEWQDLSAQEHVVLNLLLMNLHVSLDDLQLFSGKDGEDEARRIYPILQEWVSSPVSRSAVLYAGQILRYAKLFPPGHLKDFYAVAVHHAALALWTYGVVVRANRQSSISAQYGYEPVYLDGSGSGSVQRFLGFEQGRPLIQGPTVSGAAVAAEASIYDPRACMDIAHEILQSNFKRAQDALPPIVENLCQLIKQLGNAAWAVGLG